MELDELKQHLNQQPAHTQQHSAGELMAILQRDARSVVQKIQHSLWIEFGFTLFSTIACIMAALYTNGWAYHTAFTVFGIAGIGLSVAMYYLIHTTGKRNKTDHAVKQNLEAVISIISRYTRLYTRLGTALLPFCFGLGFWLSYGDPMVADKPIRWDVFTYLCIAVAIITYISFRLTNWYIRKLYGNYLTELKSLLKEINE